MPYIVRGSRYHAAGRIFTPKPIIASIRVTGRCNSRCVMCLEWQRGAAQRELTPSEVGHIFSNPLFASLEKVVLSGGEPTMREDLAQLADAVLESCPSIGRLVLLTNGLEPTQVEWQVRKLLELSRHKGLARVVVSVSLDGYGDIHQQIRRVPRAFERTVETITRLKSLQRQMPFILCVTGVIQPLNAQNLLPLLDFCKNQELPINLAPVCNAHFFTENTSISNIPSFTRKQLSQLKLDFNCHLRGRMIPTNSIFLKDYLEITAGHKRRLPCLLLYHYACLASDGVLYGCTADSSLVHGNALENPADELWHSNKARAIRKRVRKELCPSCTIYCEMAATLEEEFFSYALYKLKRILGILNQ